MDRHSPSAAFEHVYENFGPPGHEMMEHRDIDAQLEAARTLPETARSEQVRKFRALILSLPETDGSFVDSHELGKSYGTAMALLILNRVR